MALADRVLGAKVLSRQPRLQCGRTVDEVWEAVQAGRADDDAHISSCRYCRTTVDGLMALRSATAELVADAPRASPSMFDSVMRAVRTEARRGDTLELFGGTDAARVSVRAVSGLARLVVDGDDRLAPVSVQASRGAEVDQVDISIAAEVLGDAQVTPMEVEQRLRRELVDMLAQGVGLRLGVLRLQLRRESQ